MKGLVKLFLATVSGTAPVVILPHDNPDPDALASAAALKFLCHHSLGQEVTIALGGIVARAENRAMLTYLDISLHPVEEIDFSGSARIVLVDTQPGRRNNSLPAGIRPVAVIDHHPAYGDYGDIPFTDLRGFGATASMLTEYLFDADLKPDSQVATALFYGIAAETQHLGREATSYDVLASNRLYPFANKKRISRIANARVPAAYFRTFRDAIQAAVVFSNLVICDLGPVDYPDLAAEVADFLLRLEAVHWSAVLGRHDGRVYVSLRTTEPEANAGDLLRTVLGSNSAGGHGMIAGGSIQPEPGEAEKASSRIRERILKHLGLGGQQGRALID